jgi:iron complex transport system substrate-binding protein
VIQRTACRRVSRSDAFRTICAACAVFGVAALAIGCDRSEPRSVADAVVSLSPAGTSLIVAIGAADRLAGVSTYDADPRFAALPRVGDYENVDWERIRSLAPKVMVTQQAPSRLPAGFVNAAREASITICPIHIDRLADIGIAMEAIGDALGRAEAARVAWAGIEAELAAVRERTESRPVVSTLLVTSDESLGVAGTQTFLDDLLEVAHGRNAAERAGYFQLDREQLLQLDPQAIVLLLPDAKPDVVERAIRSFDAMPTLKAVQNKTIVAVTRSDVLQPNANVATTARELADAIHPKASR